MAEHLGSSLIFQFFLVLTRILAALTLLPALNASYFPRYIKVSLALGSALLLLGTLAQDLPPLPRDELTIALYLLSELIIGAVIGFATRLYFWALDALGSLLSMLSGLSSASFFDPTYRGQTSIFSTFLSLLGIMAIFASDVHHLFLHGIGRSYQVFKPGAGVDVSDMTKLITELIRDSSVLSFQISAPFLVVNLVIQLGYAMLSRLVPNIQIFFVSTPIQVIVNLAILLLTLNVIIMKVLSQYDRLWP